jgi:hypothetical protein
MKRFACLVIVAAFALPCAATGPKADGTVRPQRPSTDPRQFVFAGPKLGVPTKPPPPPPKMLDDDTVCAVLFPAQTAAREAMKQTGLTKWLKAQKFHAEWRLWMNDNGAR